MNPIAPTQPAQPTHGATPATYDGLQHWRGTVNALEAIATQHCDDLLIPDELGQIGPKTVSVFLKMRQIKIHTGCTSTNLKAFQ